MLLQYCVRRRKKDCKKNILNNSPRYILTQNASCMKNMIRQKQTPPYLQAMRHTGNGAAVLQPGKARLRNSSGFTLQSGSFIHHHRRRAASTRDDRRNCRATQKDQMMTDGHNSLAAGGQVILSCAVMSLTVNLQAKGGFSSSSLVDGDALVRPGIRELRAFDGQHLTPLQKSQTSCTGQRTAIFVPSDS